VIVNAIEAGDRDGYYYSYQGYGTPEDTKAQGSAA
jgi:hypothetical protein